MFPANCEAWKFMSKSECSFSGEFNVYSQQNFENENKFQVTVDILALHCKIYKV